MPSITAAGIGSGLDVDSIVESLMEIERRPLDLLVTRQATFEAQLSSYGKLKSALSTFQASLQELNALNKYQIHSAVSSSEDTFTSEATASAVPGTYSIQFDDNGTHQLATSHRMNSTLSVADSSTATGGTGTLNISLGAEGSFDVEIDGTNNSLNGIRDAINSASGNVGVVAKVINADSGPTLVLTSDKTGADNTISLTDSSGNVASTLGMTDNGILPQNAILTIDGFTVTSASNSVTSAVDGISINLKALDEVGTTQSLTIERDISAVTDNVQAFVNTYNRVKETLDNERAGELSGDTTLLALESRIRNVLNSVPSGINSNYSYLSEIGITTLEGGNLTLDTSELSDALNDDFSGVAQMLASEEQGYLYRLESMVDGFLDIDGLIDSRESGLDLRIDSLLDQQASYEFRLELVEKRYRSQFSALDSLIANMQSTSTFLTSQLANLPSSSS